MASCLVFLLLAFFAFSANADGWILFSFFLYIYIYIYICIFQYKPTSNPPEIKNLTILICMFFQFSLIVEHPILTRTEIR